MSEKFCKVHRLNKQLYLKFMLLNNLEVCSMKNVYRLLMRRRIDHVKPHQKITLTKYKRSIKKFNNLSFQQNYLPVITAVILPTQVKFLLLFFATQTLIISDLYQLNKTVVNRCSTKFAFKVEIEINFFRYNKNLSKYLKKYIFINYLMYN